MAGPDLTVNYELLAEFQKNLNFILQDFNGLKDEMHNLDDRGVWGADEVKGAMDHFQSDWNVHRKKLEGSIKTLLNMVNTTTGYFQQADQDLTNALHSDNNPQPPAGGH